MKAAPKRVALSGRRVSGMLELGYIDSLIPLGAAVPGIKIGLATPFCVRDLRAARRRLFS
jgi:hypothetical protein